MSLNRRRFLESASLALLANAALPAAFARRPSGLRDDPFSQENAEVLANASEETFKPFIGETFAVMQGSRRLESLTLLEVTNNEPAPSATRPRTVGRAPRAPEQAVKSFSLHFEGTGRPRLAQRIYAVENNRLGRFPLFLTPGNPEVSPQRYVASFSLLVL